ncbi:MAG TPA: transporter [Thermoanaerobaculia bacterium]|nr:transporter [Thermoanaerobaculia bacterium]
MRPLSTLSAAGLIGLLVALTALPAAAEPPAGPPPIQDNSLLLEEAYNQEFGVVQHINTFTRSRGGDWVYTFTQEWPVGGIRHQLSYTLPWQRLAASADGRQGGGDVALNYRFQLLGNGEAPVAVAPRFTLLLPTGDERQGRGAGAVGYQLSLPLSVLVGERVVAHSNLGLTYTPRARGLSGERADLAAYSLGQSFVWLLHPRCNFLVELAYTRSQTVAGAGRTARDASFFINPALRWSYNLPNGLQIVPALGVPIGVGPSAGERSIFLYLSFEHPFKRLP